MRFLKEMMMTLPVLAVTHLWAADTTQVPVDTIVTVEETVEEVHMSLQDTTVSFDEQIVLNMDALLRAPYFDYNAVETDSVKVNIYNFPVDSIPTYDDAYYKAFLDSLDALSPFDLVYNDRVKAFINLYTVKRRTISSRVLGLQAEYFPMFEEVLDQYNMPYEIKYLAIVESALNPTIKSRVGATGLWQFMYSTGKIYGLEQNSYMDERMDPVKSTHAACQFLSKLYKTYGKWDLALAAYNCGPGNVNKAIRRSGKSNGNFWDIYPYLPRETRGYVPAFIAVNYMMNNSEAHNLYPKIPNHIYFDTDTIEVAKPLDFELIAQGLDVSVEELKYLNPSYRMEVVPAYSNKTNILRLPHDQALVFVAMEDSLYAVAESKIPNSGKLAQKFEQNKVTYRVKSGDYLGKIASKYNVSVSSIKRWNGLSSNNIRAGQKLVIYPKGSYAQNNSKPAPKKTVPKIEKNGNYTYYEIQSGDTLWDIAKSQGVSVDDIMKYNSNLNSSNLKPGTKIIVGVS